MPSDDLPPPPPPENGVLTNAAGVVAPQNLLSQTAGAIPNHSVSLANWRDVVGQPNAAALAQARLSARAAQQQEDDLVLNLLLERRRAAELQQAAGLSAAAAAGLPGYYGLGGAGGFPPGAALGLAPGAAAPGALGLGASAHLLGAAHPSAALLQGRDFLAERDAAILEAARAQQAAALGGLPPAYLQHHPTGALARQWEVERARQLELHAHELELRAKMQEQRAVQAAAYAQASSAHAAGHTPHLLGAAASSRPAGLDEDRKPQATDTLLAAANAGVAKEDSDAFQLFFTEEREKVMKEIEERSNSTSGSRNAGPAKIKFQELSAIVASRWENLPTRQRQYYQNLAGGKTSQNQKGVTKKKRNAKQKLKGAPKRPGSAFLLFSNSRRRDTKRDHPTATNAELSKILSTLWKEAPEEVRQHYIEEAQVRASAYKEEMAAFIRKMHETHPKETMKVDGQGEDEDSIAVSSKRKAPESESDDEESAAIASHGKNVPKRPMSAFLAFSNKRRRALKLQHPTASNADLSKMLSKTWKEAPDVVKQKYLEEAQEKSEEYKEAIAQWRKSHPGERINRSSLQIMAAQKGRPRKKKKATIETDQAGALTKEDVKADTEDDSLGYEEASELKSMDEKSKKKQHHTNVSVEGQIVKLFHENKWDALTLASRVSDLCRVFRWVELKTSVVDCYRKSRDENRKGMEPVINRSKALNIFRTKISGADVGVLCDELVEDFVDAFEKLTDTDADKISDASIAMKYLMQLGTAEQLERVQDRSNRFPLEILETAQKLVEEARGVDARDENAVERFVDIIGTRYSNLKIEALMKRHDELVEATKDSESLTPDHANFHRYRKNMVELRDVCLQLRKLGKNVELLGSPPDPEEAEEETGSAGGADDPDASQIVVSKAEGTKEVSENEYITADEDDDEVKDTVDRTTEVASNDVETKTEPSKAESEAKAEADEGSIDKQPDMKEQADNLGDDISKDHTKGVEQKEKQTQDMPLANSKEPEDQKVEPQDSPKAEDPEELPASNKESISKTDDIAADDEEETDTEDEGSVSEKPKTKE